MCNLASYIGINRVPACLAGLRRGVFTCDGWLVTLCDPIWQVTSGSSEMESINNIVIPHLKMRTCDWSKSRHVAVNKSR